MKINQWTTHYIFNLIAASCDFILPPYLAILKPSKGIFSFSLTLLFSISVSANQTDFHQQTVQTEMSIKQPLEQQKIAEKKIISKSPITDPFRFLHHYKAFYLVMSKGDTLGKAERTLINKNGIWMLNTYAKVSKYFLTLRNTEKTEFHIDNSVLFVDYFYSNSKLSFKKARKIEQRFDWESKIETGSYKKKKWQRPIEPPVYDRVSHLIQLRADLIAGKKIYSYPISHKGKTTEYTYQLEKEEIISTKMGDLNSLKLVRIKSNGDKFVFWLCPELNYIPVKIAQYEIGEPDITLLLDTLEYNPNQTKDIEPSR